MIRPMRRRNMVLKLAVFLLAVLAAGACSREATITRVALKDGTTLYGTTVETRRDGIVVRTSDGQLRTIPLSDLAEVRHATDAEIATLGRQLNGGALTKLHAARGASDGGAGDARKETDQPAVQNNPGAENSE